MMILGINALDIPAFQGKRLRLAKAWNLLNCRAQISAWELKSRCSSMYMRQLQLSHQNCLAVINPLFRRAVIGCA